MGEEKQERSRKIVTTALAFALAMATPNLFLALDRSRGAFLIVLWSATTIMFAAAFLRMVWSRKR